MKRCSSCGVDKALTEFWRCTGRRDGRQTSCKTCQLVKQHERNRAGYNRQQYAKLRASVLAQYGSSCQCCGEHRPEFLAIDHIDGGGNAHRRDVGGGAKFLRWLRDNNYPPGFRVLCHNCNMALGFSGYCPHERERAMRSTPSGVADES